MLIFGGQGGGNALNDLWSLDLDSGAWSDITPESGPGERTFPASVYDPATHRFVIFGGAGKGGLGARSGETWAFDLAAGGWTLLQPGGAAPEARSGGGGGLHRGREPRPVHRGRRGGRPLQRGLGPGKAGPDRGGGPELGFGEAGASYR